MPLWSLVGRPVENVLQRSQQKGERRTKLVADVREERGFGPIELSQGFGPLSFGLVGLRVADRRRNLSGHKAEKAAVALVKEAKRVEPHDEHARPTRLSRG